MLNISFEQLLYKIKTKDIPKEYAFLTPITIKYRQFIEALNELATPTDFHYFIKTILNTKDLIIKSNNKSYCIKSVTDLVCLYFENNLHKSIPQNNSIAMEEYINKCEFSKQQIISLLNAMTSEDLNYYVFFYECFKEKDLYEIASDASIISKLPYNSIGLLYTYFTKTKPELQIDKPPTPLIDIYYLASRAGHIFGLKGGIRFTVKTHYFNLQTEYAYAGTCLDFLTSLICKYSEKTGSTVFGKILDAFAQSNSLIIPDSNYYASQSSNAFLDAYNMNRLVYISSGWDKHTVGIALYGDYLIYANRGEGGANNTGCRIFKIRDRALVNASFIKDLTDGKIKDYKEFEKVLNRACVLNSPVASFRSKFQKYQTCSFVNPKASIEALIVLVQAGPFASVEELEKECDKESGRTQYKSFTSFIRDCEIDELIKNMFQAKDEYLVSFYVALVKQIMYQHCGSKSGSVKEIEEYNRISKLYESLPFHIKELLDNDDVFVCFVEETGYYDQIDEYLSSPPDTLIFQSQSTSTFDLDFGKSLCASDISESFKYQIDLKS